jgi:hypothetical protein
MRLGAIQFGAIGVDWSVLIDQAGWQECGLAGGGAFKGSRLLLFDYWLWEEPNL